MRFSLWHPPSVFPLSYFPSKKTKSFHNYISSLVMVHITETRENAWRQIHIFFSSLPGGFLCLLMSRTWKRQRVPFGHFRQFSPVPIPTVHTLAWYTTIKLCVEGRKAGSHPLYHSSLHLTMQGGACSNWTSIYNCPLLQDGECVQISTVVIPLVSVS